MFELLTQVGLPIALILIMWSVGLCLSLADFCRVVEQSRAFLLGVAAQMLLLPSAVLVCIGLFILALYPSGVTSNLEKHRFLDGPAAFAA